MILWAASAIESGFRAASGGLVIGLGIGLLGVLVIRGLGLNKPRS